jgi:hypothetical protein
MPAPERRMKRHALAGLLVVLWACTPRPDPDALVTRRVTGAFTLSHWQDDGTITVAADDSVSGSSLSAFSWEPTGARSAPGTLGADGTFTIASAPADPFYLVLDTRAKGFNVVLWEADGADLPVDRTYAGRPDTAKARSSTPVTVSVSNLEPWASGVLEATSSNAGFLAVLAGSLFGAPDLPSGAVDTSALPGPMDWYTRTRVPYLPDASRGDDVWVHQLQARSIPAGQPGAGLAYLAAARYARITDLTMQSGVPVSLTASLVGATPHTLPLTLPVSQWEALKPAMGVGPTAIGTLVSVAATPFSTSLPSPWIEGGIPDLLYAFLPAGSGNLSGASLVYGRFLDARWKEVLITEFRASVQYPVSGGIPVTMFGKIYRAEPLGGDPGTISPVVGPPADPLINGKNLFGQEAGVTTTPTLSWSSPHLGTATSYELEIFRLNSNSTATLVLHAFLRSASFRVPAEILLPSSSYFARITAHSAPWDVAGYLGTYGFVPGFPFAFASCLTSTFSP